MRSDLVGIQDGGIAGSRDPAIPDALREGDEVEVSWGPETFTPVKFHAFTVGPYTARTKVRAGETAHQAFGRASLVLDELAREEFTSRLAEHLRRVEEAARMSDKAAERSRAR